MSSVFTKIIQGEIPCYKIIENDNCIAFLDIFPIKEGHVLVVPKKEINHWSDLDAETLQSLMLLSQHIAKAIKKSFRCERVGVVIAGFDVALHHDGRSKCHHTNDSNKNKCLCFPTFGNERPECCNNE